MCVVIAFMYSSKIIFSSIRYHLNITLVNVTNHIKIHVSQDLIPISYTTHI